ncbi:hypothetical protein L3Q82_014857, partial [Scortum barcoo]
GLCVYVNKDWCTNCTLVNSHCSEAIEHMTVKCRPHYLPPVSSTAVFVTAVYIPPGAKANEALKELHNNISSLQHKHPEAFYVVAGDFNHVNLTDTLPKFYQHVTIPTRGNNTLDRVYTNKRDAYRAVPHPHLGFSDHISIMLLPAYRPLLRHTPTQRTITVWPSDAVPALQDCFQRTDWQIFREAAVREGEVDLEDYTSAVLGYISKCTEDVTSTRTVTELSEPETLAECGGPVSAESQGCCVQVCTRFTPPPGEEPLRVTAAEVRRTLQRINPRKAAGPDNISGRVLKGCAYQLTEVLTDIFNTSLQQAAVPTCLKTATIIPIPKTPTVTGLNDYRPVALTPIVMKCFERLVMAHIKDCVDVTVDPHQYAYRKNRSTEDAISSVVHTALTHLENKDSYVRLLFVDFTSASNTIIPQTLVQKLTTLGLSSTLSSAPAPPKGCVLSPLLFTLLTHDCSAIHPSCLIVKFADDTAVVGRIANNDESDYRQEVEHLEGWCRQNNLCINVKKTKEMIVDFRRGRHLPSPLYIGGTAVEVVSSFRYLGVHISDDLTWSKNTSCLIRKAHQRLYFLRRLRRAGMGSSVLTSFYRCVVESVLSSCIIVWHGSCSAAEKKALQRVVKAAQRTVGRSLPHHHGHLHLQMQETGLLHHEGPHSHCTHMHCLSPSPQAGGCGALRAGPPD